MPSTEGSKSSLARCSSSAAAERSKPDAEAFAGAIVLEDHWIAETPRRVCDVVLADDRQSLRRLDAEFRERFVLRDLREFELQRALAVDDHGGRGP